MAVGCVWAAAVRAHRLWVMQSILMACKAYRDYAATVRGVKKPEMWAVFQILFRIRRILFLHRI